jgi:hypothetical protein
MYLYIWSDDNDHKVDAVVRIIKINDYKKLFDGSFSFITNKRINTRIELSTSLFDDNHNRRGRKKQLEFFVYI